MDEDGEGAFCHFWVPRDLCDVNHITVRVVALVCLPSNKGDFTCANSS
jgi:hypothetical protein